MREALKLLLEILVSVIGAAGTVLMVNYVISLIPDLFKGTLQFIFGMILFLLSMIIGSYLKRGKVR